MKSNAYIYTSLQILSKIYGLLRAKQESNIFFFKIIMGFFFNF